MCATSRAIRPTRQSLMSRGAGDSGNRLIPPWWSSYEEHLRTGAGPPGRSVSRSGSRLGGAGPGETPEILPQLREHDTRAAAVWAVLAPGKRPPGIPPQLRGRDTRAAAV